MIFVDMTAHDLLSRTAHYQIRESSPHRPSNDADFVAFYDNVDESRPASRRQDSGADRTVPPPLSNSLYRNTQRDYVNRNITLVDNPFPLIDPGDESTPPPRTTAASERPGFEITTSCSDPSSDEEEPSSAATLADLYRRDHLPPPYTSSTDEDDEHGLERAMRLAGGIGVPSSHRRTRRRAKPRKIEVVWPSNTTETDTGIRTDTDILAPHAKFFIERERSAVTIKFDPPV